MPNKKYREPEEKWRILKAYLQTKAPSPRPTVKSVCEKYDVSRQNIQDWLNLATANADILFDTILHARKILEENKKLRTQVIDLKQRLEEYENDQIFGH
jgi:transposase-like protein